jgi:Zn-dependent protease
LNGIEVSQKLISFLTFLPLFFISLTIHEFAHAYSAYKLGDNTAKDLGRLSLNPIKHLDLIGSVIMPIMSFASGFALIGWAKPVPVNRANLKNGLRDDAVVSFAGPLSNLVLAVIFFFCFLALFHNHGLMGSYNKAAADMIWYGFYFNIFLFFFNLIPIPPLDGSFILYDLFPNKITAKLLSFGLYGSLILMFFIYSPLWGIFMKLITFVMEIFINLAGI